MLLQTLLRDREEDIVLENVYERKPTYYFMDTFFMNLAKGVNPKRETKALIRFYVQWASCGVGPPIKNVDFIFVPAHVSGNHWVLFIFAVKNWGVILLDPLYDDAEYPEEERVMVSILHFISC